ncbi:gag-polypeptide of LTR copia-type domain-containing protein [Phthorimaea operculella]|nr:gag-polypeptide of LTR copia-type domain-containing protein [Phthorimaea operculella]
MDPATTSSSEATSSSNQTAVEKLNSSLNYSSWSFTMKNLLIVSDLWDVVDQPEEKLTELGEQAFKRLDAKAKARICLNLEKHVFPVVINAETSSETWENLKKNYADSGLLRKLHLLRSLFNSKLEQHQNMQEYVSKIRGIHQQLLEIGEKSIQDSFIGTIMLTGLPESYNPLVMAFENSGVEVTSDSVSAILLKEDQRRATSTSSAENAAAFHTKPPHCSFCKKFGHMSKLQPTLAINPLDQDCTVGINDTQPEVQSTSNPPQEVQNNVLVHTFSDATSLPEVSDDVSAAPQPQNDLPSEPCESESVDPVDTFIDAEPASPVEAAGIPEAATSEPRYPQRERHPPIRNMINEKTNIKSRISPKQNLSNVESVQSRICPK